MADEVDLQALTPTTAGLPNCRATKAAWLVRPPRLVRIPSAASMPCTSSGLVSGRTMMTLRPSLASAAAMSGSNAVTPTAAPGETLRPVAIAAPRRGCACAAVELRMEEEVDLAGRHPAHRVLLADEAFLGEVHRDAHGGLRGPLAVARLQQPQLAVLDGELDVLHVAVVGLERARDLLQLGVRPRHHSAAGVDGAGGSGCRRRRLRPAR